MRTRSGTARWPQPLTSAPTTTLGRGSLTQVRRRPCGPPSASEKATLAAAAGDSAVVSYRYADDPAEDPIEPVNPADSGGGGSMVGPDPFTPEPTPDPTRVPWWRNVAVRA